jgi:uncharacterized protein Smg (DUF494 family)
MNRRILKALAYLFRELSYNQLEDLDLQMVTDLLMEQGFSDEEISIALTWIGDQNEWDNTYDPLEFQGLPRPVWRQLNDAEQDVLSPKAFGYLVHLRESNVLGDAEMEMVIDHAIRLDIPQMSIEDMQDLIAVVMLDVESNASHGFFQFTPNRLPH